jgi:hypothetical protein
LPLRASSSGSLWSSPLWTSTSGLWAASGPLQYPTATAGIPRTTPPSWVLDLTAHMCHYTGHFAQQHHVTMACSLFCVSTQAIFCCSCSCAVLSAIFCSCNCAVPSSAPATVCAVLASARSCSCSCLCSAIFCSCSCAVRLSSAPAAVRAVLSSAPAAVQCYLLLLQLRSAIFCSCSCACSAIFCS